MAKLVSYDFSFAPAMLFEFTDNETWGGQVSSVEIDTGDRDADVHLRMVPAKAWLPLANQALAHDLAMRCWKLEAALEDVLTEGPEAVRWTPGSGKSPSYRPPRFR